MRGEVLTLALPDCFIASGGLDATGDALLAYQACPDRLITTAASAQTGEIIYSLGGAHGQSFAVSPNGARLVRQEGTSNEILDTLAVRDLKTGELVTRLHGLCKWDAKSTAEPGHTQEGCSAFPNPPFPFWVWDLEWSPDGTLIAASHDPSSHGGLAAWDAASGELISAHDFGPGRSAADLVFTPDSSQILVSVLDRGGPTTIQRIDIETWEVLETVEVTPEGGESAILGLLGLGPDGRLIGVSGWRGLGAALVWFDGDTLEIGQRQNGIHDGSPRDGSLDQSGRQIATASSDGSVRIWDATTGNLLHEIRLGDVSINAVDFVNQHHLLVGTNDGKALVMTSDPEELVNVVRNSLTRGFSPAECERFNFGDDCPTLEDMRRP
jgi:WD40 repeat protein